MNCRTQILKNPGPLDSPQDVHCTWSVCFVSSSWPQISIRTTVQYMYSVQYLSMYIMLDDFIYVQFLCTLYIHVARLSGPNRQLPAVLRGAVQFWPGSGSSYCSQDAGSGSSSSPVVHQFFAIKSSDKFHFILFRDLFFLQKVYDCFALIFEYFI